MGKGGGWKDGCSRLLTAVVVVPGMEIGWLEGIEREGQGLNWIGLDCILEEFQRYPYYDES